MYTEYELCNVTVYNSNYWLCNSNRRLEVNERSVIHFQNSEDFFTAIKF